MLQWRKRRCLPGEPRGIHAMRQTFHYPALTTCGASLPPGKKYVAVSYLTKELVFFVVDVKSKGYEVFEDACKYLGLQDTELFGLAFIQDDDYIFIDPNLKISKYAVKSWKTSDFGTGGDGQPLLVLYLRVKHYVDCHLLISEKVARHHYYLQMRENVRNYSQALSEEKSFLLAALALQADLGNYSEERHKGRYFEISNYFPSWIIVKIGDEYISQNLPALHKDNAGLSRGEAQVSYIREASDVTASHNLQFYKIRRRKGKSWNNVWLGIKDGGIDIYEQQDSRKTKSLLSTFLWCDIVKLYFEKKKFEILSEGIPEYRKFTYYASSEELAKNLLWMCRTTHHFHMSNEARVQELKKLELDGGRTYRESYIYTDKQDLAWQEKQNPLSRKSSQCLPVVTSNGNLTDVSEGSRNAYEEKRSFHKSSPNSSETGNVTSPMSKVKIHSMEVLPLTKGCVLSSDTKYKSQSIACFSDRFLTPCTVFTQGNTPSHLWSPTSSSSLSITPTSTLLSRSSCASCTDSACSSLSLTSGSTIKATCPSKNRVDDSNQWVKCDSFEELALSNVPVESKSLPHKVCISTFKDSHVRTASLYDAASICSKAKPQVSKSSYTSVYTSHPSVAKQDSYSGNLHGFGHTSYKSASKKVPVEIAQSKSKCPVRPVSQTSTKAQNVQNLSTSRSNEVSGHLYSRTATRIGVSSLSRDQRLPLALFSNRGKMTACGSEPNLYNFLDGEPGNSQLMRESPGNGVKYMEKPNSRSEICLNVIGRNMSEFPSRSMEPVASLQNRFYDAKERLSVYGSHVVDGESDFPCIPPPPGYRNSTDDVTELSTSPRPAASVPNIVNPKDKVDTSHILRSASDAHRELRSCISSPPDVLDLHQLRQRSQALDLPLISALCNDRSLLMLPKTVPTCSRQRHLGSKDPLRFARGYSTAPGTVNTTDVAGSLSARPFSWHVVSSDFTSYPATPSGSSSWYKQNSCAENCNGSAEVGSGKQNLPSTILTSFGKSQEKQSPHSSELSYKSSDYRLNKMQMIPMKLLAGNIVNGRVHQKGSSS